MKEITMKKYENGQYIEMSDEEIAMLQHAEESNEPSIEDRLVALESAMLEQILGVTK